ncbi:MULTISPECIES: hypothetical protein [Hyphobacterium]|uniref:Tip attachment protein J domain-containing protein n=1 Tax=Hyphobacterium vulgare TaxID=1736751 RepID=A0ABV6ZU66_9PROT
MSKVVKIIVGAVLVVGSFFMGGTTWPAVVRLLGTGLLSSATKPKIPPTTQSIEQRLNISMEPEAFGSIVFGETAVDTQLRYWEVWSNQTKVDYVLAAAVHEIESFGDLYIEDDLVSFSGNDATGKYAGVLTRRTRTVGVTGTYLTAGAGGIWKAALGKGPWMTGLAHFVLSWTVTPEKLPGGIPTRITQKGKGAKLYDPRRDSTRGGSGSHRADDQSTWEYSPLDSNGVPIGRNAALQILWYRIGWRVQNPDTGELILRAGEGVPLDDIDFASFIEAANRCEEEEYYSDCLLSTGTDHNSNLAVLEAACAGTSSDAGGLYSLHIWTDDTASVAQHFEAEDIVGEAEWHPKVSLVNHFNQGHGTFIDPDALYQRRDYPVVRDEAYEAEDGRKRRKAFHYEAVTNPDQAQKLTRLELNRSRLQGVYQAPFNWKANNVQMFSVVTLTVPRRGWTEKIFRVIDIRIDPLGPIYLVLREDGPSVYEGGTVLPLDPPGTGSVYDPRDVPTPSVDDWSAAGISVTTGSGESLVGHPALRIVGDFTEPNVISAVIDYRLAIETNWTGLGEFASTVDFSTLVQPLSPDTLYDVSIRYRNAHRILGSRLVIEDVQAPPFFTSDDSVNLGGVPAQTVFREIESIRAQQAASFASIETERLLRVTENEAFAQQVFTLRTDVDGNTAQIQTNFTTLSTSISANASAITSLDARVTTAEGDIVTNAAAISTEATARATEDAALAALITALEAEVDTNADGIADNAAAIVTEQTARADGDSALSSQITSLTATVDDNAAAISAEATARATADETLARRADTQEARLAGALAAIQVETETRATRDESFATRFYSVEAGIAGNAAAILVEQTARADGDSANASLITALTARVDTNEDDIADNAAAITTEATARADGDSALASQITTLEAEVDANAAAITTEQTARADGDSALASQITSLEAEVDANAAAITNEATARATGDSANASAITALDARVTTNEGDIDANAANITTEQGVRATQSSAIAQRLDRLSAQIAGVAAGITTETEARATDTEALARREQILSARLGTAEALVSTLEEVFIDENGAVAAWINRVVAGDATATVEITARDENGDAVSHIRLKADSIGFGEDGFFEYVDEDPAYANQPNIYLRDKDGTVVLDGRDLSVADWRRPDVLTRAMKVQTVPYWQSLIDEEASLVARAALLSISSTAYEAAMDAFIAELDSYDAGQPDWDDMTGDTVIDNATLTPLINTVETTRNALRAAIRAALRWGDLLERPTWVTDDRVPNGLNGSGDLIRALTSDSLVPSLPASKIGSGTFANARIAQASVTQHQAALALAASQVTTGTFANARIAQASVTQHQAALALAASQVTSGTFADARIAQSSVTQHQGALAIGSGQVSGLGSLAALNNISDAQIDASAAIKLTKIDRLTGEDAYNNAPSAPPATVNFTATTFTEIATVTLNNVPANPIIILNNTQEFWPVGSDAANSAATKLEWRIREWDGAAGADIAAGEITFRDDFGTIVYDSGGPLETVGGRIYSAFRNGTVDYILEFRVSAGTQVNFLETTKLQIRAI